MLRAVKPASLMCSDKESIRRDRAACKWGIGWSEPGIGLTMTPATATARAD